MRLLWEWVNDPSSRDASLNSEFIEWESHVKWFENMIVDNDARPYIIEDKDNNIVAQVRFDRIENGTWRVDFTTAPEFRGKGLAGKAMRMGCEKLAEDENGIEIIANVKVDNIASVKMCTKAGYKKRGKKIYKGCSVEKMVWSNRTLG